MPDTITVTGLVATPPRHLVTSEGLPITSFRLASSQRRFDRSQERWVDGETNWYTITGFRQLAINAAASVKKGDRVVIVGKLKIRDWENGERSGTTIEIDAEALGHDLMWGSSAFIRSVSTTALPTAEAAGEHGPADEFPSADDATALLDGSAADTAADAEADESGAGASGSAAPAAPSDAIPVPF
jgi:single-strand DNA-binding protein